MLTVASNECVDAACSQRERTDWGSVVIDGSFPEPLPPAPPQPDLLVSPGYVETGVEYDDVVTEIVTLQNLGDADLQDVSVSLLPGPGETQVPDWITLNSPAELGVIPAGQQREVRVRCAPTPAVPEGWYAGVLQITSAELPAVQVDLHVLAMPSAKGHVLFKVSDIYTGTLNDQGDLIQGLAGATIRIQHETLLNIDRTQTSDSIGESLFEDLPIGRYRYRITAPDHLEQTGWLWVKTAVTAIEEIFLEYDLVTVEWDVREIPLEDTYEIVLKASYKTDVPAPVVVVEPASVTLPKMQLGDVYQGEFTLVNYGLIRAENLRLNLPDEGVYRFELLPGVPDSLDAKERVTVPYRVTRVQPVQGAGDGSGGGDNCGYTLACWTIPYEFPCPNGTIILKEAKRCENVWLGDCPPSDSSEEPDNSPPPIWQISGGSLGGSTRSGSSRTIGGKSLSAGDPIPGTEDDCYPTCSDRECCTGKCGEKPMCDYCLIPTLSSVHALNRSYHTEGPGLSVKTPGGYFSVSPKYKDGIWLFGPEQSGPDGLPAEAGNLQFHQYGDAQRGSVISSIIKDGGIAYNLPAENFALKKVYDDDDILVSEQYVYTGERLYQHAKAYAIVKTDSGYRWKKTTGKWQDYDENGRLTAFGNRHGTTATVLYDATGKVRGYADKNGTQVLWVEYNAEGRIAALRDAAGQQVTYAYDPQGRLASIIDVSAPSTGSGQVTETTYQYTGSQLTKVIKPGGQEANISYTQAGNVQSVKDEEGEGSTFNYSYDSRKGEYYTRITSSSGTIKEVWYDEDGDTKRVAIDGETIRTIEQDEEINALTIFDADGQETRQEYDEWDNLKKVIYPDGSVATYEYDRPYHQLVRKNDRGVITTYAYNDDGALTRLAEAVGTETERITEYTYNAEGNRTHLRLTENAGSAMEVVTEEEYDADGNRTRLVEAMGTAFERKTEYTYTDGNLTSIIKYLDESTTVETTMEYDEDGNLKKKVDPSGETSYTYTEDGNIDTVTTVQGTWDYEYDTEGRLSVVTDPFGNTRKREYDEDGNVKAVKVNGETVSTYTYDMDGNLIERTDVEGNVYQFAYNADGQLIGQSDPEGASFQYEYDANGRLSKTIDGNGNEIFREYGSDDTSSSGSACLTCSGTSSSSSSVIERFQKIIYPTFTKKFMYDDEGRVSEEIYTFNGGETSSVTYAYDQFGRLQSTTGPDGRSTTYGYDRMGRRIRMDDPSGQTQFEYDNWDNLIALIDANNQRTEFEYDTLGRLKKEIRPMSQETTYEYNEKGQLWKMVDAKLQMTEYGYDAQGRLETISYADGKTVILNYDADGNLAGYSDGETSAEYNYDDLGRKIWERVNYGSFSKEFSYTYHKNGLKKTFTVPDGTMYEYAYGNNNELREVRIPGVGAVTIPDYTWHRPVKMVFPGGTQRMYGYDALMRLKTLTATDPGGSPLLDYAYTYNEAGNIVTKATEHGNYTYDYDAMSRLLTADNPVLADESYTYDDVGNRITDSSVSGSWSYNTNNELLGYADVEYEYDANGNMTQKRVGTAAVNYIYDAANRLVKVEDDAIQTVIAEYYYDPFGRRLWKDVGGTRTYFFYSEEGLIAEYDENGVEIRSYGYKPDSTWTTDPLWLKEGGSYYWYQNDHLGTPQKLTDSSGSVVWSAQYSSFGKADVQVEMITNNLRFPGQYEDAETGLHYNFQRYYDPKIGRYLRKDPIGFMGRDVNLYRYVKNNPLNRTDPFGMASITEIENGDLFYTWHMGWLDIHHATHTDGSLIEAWKKIKNAFPGEVVPFTLSISQPLQRSKAEFCLIVDSDKQRRKYQLLYAWMLITYQFEAFQGWGFFDNEEFNKLVGLLMKGRIDQMPSSFSTEDLVSNLIFFYAVVDTKEARGKIVRQKAENLINTLAGRFDKGAKDELIISKAIWAFSLKTQSGYMKWRPQYFNYSNSKSVVYTGHVIASGAKQSRRVTSSPC